MNLISMNKYNSIPKFLKGDWIRIKSTPKWVNRPLQRDFNKNYSRGNRNPYNKIYTYKGKRYIYKIKITSDVQGGSYSYFKKKR